MRIVCWNMNHFMRSPEQRVAAWRYLESLEPDFALLQEAVVPDRLRPTHRVDRLGGIGGARPWGSAVVSFQGEIEGVEELYVPPLSLHRTYPGSVAVARANGLTLISCYAVIEAGYAITTFHRQLSDLTPLFDSKMGRRVVLGGDLNLSTQLRITQRLADEEIVVVPRHSTFVMPMSLHMTAGSVGTRTVGQQLSQWTLQRQSVDQTERAEPLERVAMPGPI